MKPDALKVLIYATCRDRLLVFDEPDFPDVQWQVPGGTVEHGEDVAEAASREFHEETGLTPGPLTQLGTHDYRFSLKNGGTVLHRRHYFHVGLDSNQSSTWLHRELTPFGGGAPILFRFFWISFSEARAKLGYGMAECLPLIG
ncbi:DNA mismatch repair protein MutT [Rhizobium sp. AC44/96]|uniref:NUDIX hydrolase n=1 Tax=Rhizobium sp. AC44/96 TaxID=1841654 RepID=UPI0008100654|nr:NUDIX hydrolase [Rhizobium sp. AC44/96]OCJ18323.1 DNA mismatch repair protein MutT [Rhizobium sp. AC44/96]